ncbi:MAG: CsbD family protein [Deltaproteobacteria bacterium]
MNWKIIEGKWDQYKGKARQKWGKLTNDDMDSVKGRRDELVGRIRERYGIAKDKAEAEVDGWMSSI